MKRLKKGFELAIGGHVQVDEDLSDDHQTIFYVISGSDAGASYMVCCNEGYWICDCDDFKVHFKNGRKLGEHGSFICKHISSCIGWMTLKYTERLLEAN